MKMKLTPMRAWSLRWLVLAAGCGAITRGEQNTAKAAVPLEKAAVFAGPDGAKFEPPAGSVAKVHVTPDRATFWKTHGALNATIKEASSLVLFQGVPREEGEEKQWSEEKKKTLFRSDGQWFRAGAQPLPAVMAERLRALIFEGVREWRGLKLCGGFHADALLTWQGGPLRAETEVLICFGCSEVKIYGATGSLYGDLAGDQAKQLRELLAPYLEKRNAEGSKASLPQPPAKM